MSQKALITLLLFFTLKTISAQPSVNFYTDIGETQVSNGTYFSMAVLGGYTFTSFQLNAGMQTSTLQEGYITDFTLSAKKPLHINKQIIGLEAYYLYSEFGIRFKETNWELKFTLPMNKHELTLGNSFKTYAFRNTFDNNDPSKIRENWNLIYAYTYHLKPINHNWNVSGTVCNFDHFMVYQETNPVVKIRAERNVSSAINVYAECWYKTAGSFNLNVNYFGYFLRTGLTWYIQ